MARQGRREALDAPDGLSWPPTAVRLTADAGARALSDRGIRADVFAALQELSEVIPEMRTGQLMAAVGELCADLYGRGLWNAADDELLEAMWQFRRNYEAAISARRGGR